MEAFLVSTGIVALAEIGDKTQLLTLLLASRFRKPWPIVAGIFLATIVNHAIAGAGGAWVAREVGENAMRWILGLSFIAMAGWMLVPDKLEGDAGASKKLGGVLLTTTILFFLVEIGDKTQIATVALAAKYQAMTAVVIGTTLGLMLANVPAIIFGNMAGLKLPMAWVRGIAAALFAGIGIVTLLGWAG